MQLYLILLKQILESVVNSVIRVIAGKHKGRKLAFLSDELTRPTQDRVKEAIFSALSSELIDAHVLDLFAGSGSVGIEALSRGAKKATFVDIRLDAINCIRHNLNLINEEAEVIKSDYQAFLNKVNLRKFDIIFVDPPYDFKYIDQLIKYLCDNIKDKAIIVFETSNVHDFEDLNFSKIKRYKFRQKYVYIMRR